MQRHFVPYPTLEELVEKGVHLMPVRGAGERRVLTLRAQPAEQRDGHEKARLTFGEPNIRDGFDAIVCCITSSAMAKGQTSIGLVP